MASSLLQSSSSSCSWFSSLWMKPNVKVGMMVMPFSSTTLKPVKLCCVMSSDKEEFSEVNSTIEGEKTSGVDPIKLAFNKAKAYKESIKSNGGDGDNLVKESNVVDGVKKEVPVSLKIAMEKAKKYKQNKESNGVSENGQGVEQSSIGEENSVKDSNAVEGGEKDVPVSLKIAMEKAKKYKQNKGVEISETNQAEKTSYVDPIKLAFNKAKAYKESIKSNSDLGVEQSGVGEENSVKESNALDGGKKDVSVSLKIAMEKAKKYKQNKGVEVSETNQGLPGESERTWEENVNDNSVGKKGGRSVSRIDFVGLDFSDNKKTRGLRGLPPGLVPFTDSFLDSDLPEVELIIGNADNFNAKTTAPQPEQTMEDESEELYKPKVSTWGVFPRPANISKTFGGGKVIRPGDILETDEEKAAKEARTKMQLAAYKKKYGLNIDPKLKSECEEILKDGDLLMDSGKLKDALPYYAKVIDKLPFQSELHGLAALQWAICQDSLSRSSEAQSMYEKLKSHPSVKVGKKARHFVYSFQAMEMMKVKGGSSRYTKNTFYQSYFDAFVENKSYYPLKVKDEVAQESEMNQKRV
ncbi:hypothetical protein TSUD_90130 [Trifolium subterraneum]|uniref:Uncharacterized protein n=1 Tax=Trifolium subterraneum TaxID=3900 RepID=A0A2Z6NTQ1_TRISU|nr:hypothetical protein TSUD_90130 [Trifolium subterraneum]